MLPNPATQGFALKFKSSPGAGAGAAPGTLAAARKAAGERFAPGSADAPGAAPCEANAASRSCCICATSNAARPCMRSNMRAGRSWMRGTAARTLAAVVRMGTAWLFLKPGWARSTASMMAAWALAMPRRSSASWVLSIAGLPYRSCLMLRIQQGGGWAQQVDVGGRIGEKAKAVAAGAPLLQLFLP